MPKHGDKQPQACPHCAGAMTFREIAERTTPNQGEDQAPFETIPAHDAWVCDVDVCKHEISAD